VKACSNAALAGCELLLFCQGRAEILKSPKRETKRVNLSQAPEFEDLFVENLYIRPFTVN